MGDLTSFTEYTSGTIAAQLATSGVPSGMGARAVRLGTETTESTSWQCVLVPTVTADPNKGRVAGKLRSLIDFDGQQQSRIGLVFGMSIEDVTGTGGSCYVFCVENVSGGQRNRLYKTTNGLDNLTQIAEFSEVIAAGTYAMEVEWRYDDALYGGAYIKCSRGANFASLATKITHLDQSTPLTTYAAEGFFTEAVTNGNVLTTYHDSFSAFELGLDSSPFRRFEKFFPVSSDASILIDLRPTPLLGSGSLLFDLSTNSPYGAQLANTAAIPASLTAGTMRMRMKVTNTGGRSLCGFLIMMSARNILGASGTAYAVCTDLIAASTKQVALVKLDAGLDSIDNLALATGNPTTLPHPAILWLEVIWQTSGGNTRIQAFVAENEDMSDRAEAFDHTDSTAALTTTAGISLFAHQDPGNVGAIDMLVNNLLIDTFPGFE